ncbi:MAG TPA: hypothetical protein VMZ01_05625 [Aestuariivirga sp.]|nr:hypothetical protein [Aestuariivirga sp.]
MQKIEDYLRHAAECRKMAATVQNPEHKIQLEEMIEAWEMLAEKRRIMLKLPTDAITDRRTDEPVD